MNEAHHDEPNTNDNNNESDCPTIEAGPISETKEELPLSLPNGIVKVESHEDHHPIVTNIPTSKEISDKLILDKIEKLNIENHELKTENGEFRSKLTQLEKSCAELKHKSDRSTVSVESVKRELQSMVIKYATSEKEVINLKKHYVDSDKKCKDVLKERDSLQTKIKELTNEKKQLFNKLERNILESATLRNENEILKNKLAQADVRIQQLQLTIAELGSQYEAAKEKLDRIENGIGRLSLTKSTPERSENIDQAQFQLTEEEEAKESCAEYAQPSTEPTSEEDKEASNWTDKYLQCIEHNASLTKELELVRSERAHYKDQIDSLEHRLWEANNQMADYCRRGELIESLKNELINKQGAIDSLKDKFDQINSINRDLVGDIDSSKHKEGELLEYTERLTAKLVSLQSEHNVLTEKLKCTEEQCEKFKQDYTSIAAASEQIKSEYEIYQSTKQSELEQLAKQLKEKESESAELSRKIDELENDIKIVKRKHISNLKELNKEIQVLKKQHDTDQAKMKHSSSQPPTETNSSTLSSRTNSFTSLCDITPNGDGTANHQFVPNNNNNNNNCQTTGNSSSNHASLSDSTSTSSSSSELITSLNDIDKNMLIERILRLQRNLNKRNEKIDFLEEHNEQLTEEVRKKSKLLQYYILKEETGALATETMDKNKAYLSRRGGGIMSSLYNSSSTDDTMTLERSLEINSKLHAVLEDTLLKNMTLKENLNTLAGEIDRLTKTKSK